MRFGKEVLGAQQGFFSQLVDCVIENFGDFYPELVASRQTIFETVQVEEKSFSRTLEKGIDRFKKAAAAAKSSVLDGFGCHHHDLSPSNAALEQGSRI